MLPMKTWPFALFAVVLFSLPAVAQQQTVPAAPDSTSLADSKTAAITKLDLTPDANGKLSQPQMQALLRVAADRDMENERRQRNYTYVEQDVTNKLDGSGQTKSTEVRKYELLEIYGEQVQRLTEKDGKPLDAKEVEKEDEKIQRIIDKRKGETEDERKKREEKEDKEREDSRKFVRDVADAYIFTLVGSEQIGGRDTWVIQGEPRPGFEPHAKDGKYLSKFHGRVWIDKSDLQLAKLDVECLDTISWGLFLARFHKGSRFMLEQTRVNDEVWLPRHVTFKLDARVALFKGYNLESEQTFADYKKFRTSSKIVGMGAPQP
jgi:hypothetical protein